jgi:hypothetical protein
MTRFQKLAGIAVVAFVVGGGMGVAVQAARSPSPSAIARTKLAAGLRVAEASRIAEGSKRSCIDLKEGTFEWRWANVPFASNCVAD